MSNLKTCGCSDVNCTHIVMKTPNGWLHVANAAAGIQQIAVNVQKEVKI